MNKNSAKYSIIIPAFHEKDRIGDSLKKLSQYLKDNNLDRNTEVIVSVQEAEEGTFNEAKKYEDRFTDLKVIDAGPRRGKGYNVRFAMKKAIGDFKLFMDADLATPLHHIRTAFDMYENGSRIVIGVRHLEQTHKGLRKFISEFGNILVRVLLLPKIHDSQCGFKGFEKETANTVFSRQTVNGWGFDMEILKIARIHKIPIDTIDADDWKDPKMEGLTGDSSISVAIETFLELLKIKLNQIRGVYR